MENFCGDAFWDNETFWLDVNPSLTSCFRQTTLIWVPCIFLFVFSILDIKWRLRSRYSHLPWTILNIAKFVIVTLLLVVSFTDLAFLISLNSQYEGLIFPVQFVSVGVKIVTFCYVIFLMYLHKIKGHLTSGVLFLFWVFLSFFAIPQLRYEVLNMGVIDINGSEIENNFQFINYAIYFTLICTMTILNCFADKPPKYSTYPKSLHPRPCAELFASFLNQIHFFWFTKICVLGWKRPLVESDLFDIPPQDTCAEVHPPFEREFNASMEKNKNKKHDKDALATTVSSGSTLVSVIKAYGGAILFSAMLRLCADLLLILAPLILGRIIIFIEKQEAMWKGFLLTFVLFLIQALQTYFMGQQYHYNFNTAYNIRGALMSSIYRKSLRLSSAAKRNTTVGEIVNLMAVDANRFFELLPEFHAIWAGAVVIGLVTWIVFQYLSYAVFAGLGVALFTFPFSVYIGTQLKALQVEQMKFKDERVKTVNEILNGMKVLKLYAWEPSFEKLVEGIRNTEISIMRRIAVYNAFAFFLFTLAPFLVAMASFITYVLWIGGTLDTQKVFVPLALFNILRVPMTFYPLVINFLMQTLVAMGRIDKFLNSAELDPTNVDQNPSYNAMTISNGNFSWGAKETTLKNINLFVKKNNLTAVVGPVGSGKSSLISAFLGEMEKLTGEVNVDGRIAYVPQQAWIQNATLRDNILFGKAYNKKLYEKVLHACALVQDLAILPGGDQIEIGEKGINLSGGQKQRVSLARAVYSGADIYIFDDPLSAVDSHVGKHIFNNVMSDHGILKSKARFLVTHALSYLPKVDEIYVMMNGEITESGTFKELQERGGAFAEFLKTYLQEEGEELLEEVVEKRQSDAKPIEENRRFSNGSINSKHNKRLSESKEAQRRMSEAREVKNEMSKLIETEDAMVGTVTWALYGRYFKRMGTLLSVVAVGSNLLYHGASVYSNIWLANWSQAGDDPRWSDYFYAGIFGGLGLLQAIFLVFTAGGFAYGCILVAKNLHNTMLSTIMRLPMWFFDTTPIGRILNRFARDMDVIDNVLPIFIRNWILLLFSVAAIYIVISFSTPWFMVIAVPIIFIYYFVQKVYIETARQTRRMESLTRSPIFAHFAESVSGQSTIRAYGEQQRFISDSESKIDYNHAIGYHVMVANRWAHLNLQLLGAFVVLFSAFFAVFGRDRHGIDGATAGLSLSYALQVATFMFFLIRIAAEVETNLVAVERVEEYADKPQEAAWKTVEIDPTWPHKGIVVFKDFKVRYREGLELVLRGISFETKSQEKVGIVGRTGAGKSSLTLSLFRIIEGAGGKIVIDGIEIAEIGLHSLRSRLTIIPQDPVLFSGSLRMNIDPFSAYSDDAIWTALEHSHLKAFIISLSDGLNYKISEGGENLSVGQRQLVCLARALLRKTKVLILDEATAAIDFETDELIQKTIRSQFNDCTILTIAHRLNTIMDSDRIIVLDQGLMAEFDTPQALLANKNSIFYGMARNAGLVEE